VAEGLGHAFCALTPTVTVGYLCNEAYAPTREHGVHPLDPALDLPWPSPDVVLSPKDAAAPLLADAVASGLVPTYDSCRNWYRGKSAT
jgi:dTDP-4-dehydrorhamnose 3,5-epimerase